MTHSANRVSDDEILAALDEALDNNRRIAAEGGILAQTLAEYCDLSPATLKDRCRDLEDEGDLVRVWGRNSDGRPVPSWLPAGHPDGSPREQRGHAGITHD